MNARQLESQYGVQKVIPGATAAAENVIERRILSNGKELRYAYVEEVVVFAGDAFKALSTALPAGSTVLQVDTNFDVAVVLVTAVKIGVGIAGTPSGLLLSTVTVAKNTKNVNAPAVATGFNAAAITPRVSAVDAAGAIAGSVTSGSVRVRIYYSYIQALPDA